jgi:flagellar hook protein FlgE
MSIQSALYSGVSGLAKHGTAMEIIGNNIANSNTVGYKASRTIFSDLLSANIVGSGGDSQVGRGVGLSSINSVFSQGSFESTESKTDLAIEGHGFFMVRDPNGSGGTNYSRAGAFAFDSVGYLVNQEGYHVQGYALNENGDPVGSVTDIKIDTLTPSPARATTKVTLSTNLNSNADYVGPFDPADAEATSNYVASIPIFDSLGNPHLVTNYFCKLDPATNPMEWEQHTMIDGGELVGGTAGTLVEIGTSTMTFDTDGSLVTSPATSVTTAGALVWANGADTTQQIAFEMNTTQHASESVVLSMDQDGFAMGMLKQTDIDAEGNIIGSYSNGQNIKIARITLAKFSNPQGLVKIGFNMYASSTESGSAVVGTPGSGVGIINTNSLEQSNVDLAQEFVKMITTQRGFQANSKIITTSDEMLQELINLKR